MTIRTSVTGGATKRNETRGLRVRTAAKAGKVSMQDFHFVSRG